MALARETRNGHSRAIDCMESMGRELRKARAWPPARTAEEEGKCRALVYVQRHVVPVPDNLFY
jgi:hypothetical protein